MNDSVVRYLDILIPLDKLTQMLQTGFTLPQAGDNIKAFSETLSSKPSIEVDANVQESTIMEGFRYRVDDSPFPIFNHNQSLKGTFPIIPVGMLDIWRQEDKNGVDVDHFF